MKSRVRSVPEAFFMVYLSGSPRQGVGGETPKHIRLWVKDSFTRMFKPTSMENPFCSLSPSQSPGRRGLDPDLPGPEPEGALFSASAAATDI